MDFSGFLERLTALMTQILSAPAANTRSILFILIPPDKNQGLFKLISDKRLQENFFAFPPGSSVFPGLVKTLIFN